MHSGFGLCNAGVTLVWVMTHQPGPAKLKITVPMRGAVRNLPIGKTVSDADVGFGPVDYQVVAFPAEKANFSGRGRPS
jgi:hypothetical protein